MIHIFSVAATILVVGWLIRLWFILYIPKKREPSSAIAWLLVVFLLPELGVILFFVIGNSKLSRHRQAIQKYLDSLIENSTKRLQPNTSSLTEAERQRYDPIIDLAQGLGKMPLSVNNTAKILPEYNTAIAEIIKSISLATEFVHLEYFILAYDNTTKPLFDALEAAVQRGVTVRVLFDWFGTRRYPRYRFMKRELTRMGVSWHKMLPLRIGKGYNRPDLRNHRKIVVIDDTVAYLGSQNMVDRTYHRKDSIVYDELVVALSGPIVRQCDAFFASDWYAETNEDLRALVDPHKRPLAPTSGMVKAQVVPSGPGYKVSGNLQLFTQLMYAAKKRIVITNPYFIPYESLMIACKSAAKRGVEVILVNSEVIDQIGVGYAQRSFYEELMEAGVKIYLYKAPTLLHSKHLTIDDDIAVIGSSNMDIRSFALDLECVVVLYDKSVVKDLAKIQQKDLSNSKRVSLRTWKTRPLRHKFLENVMRLTSALQ